MDRLKTVVFFAGIGLFLLAAVLSAVLPALTLRGIEYRSLEELAADPIPEWRDLAERWPDQFQAAFGAEAWRQARTLPTNPAERPADPAAVQEALRAYAAALDRGRDIYVAEGCWHCHSQFVRGVSREEERWGPVAMAEEFENALQLPQLWGTRRVGPDLSREWGVHSNDWHAAHFFDPRSTSPGSVMPRYPWLFEADPRWRPEEEVRAEAERLPEAERPAFLRQALRRTPQAPDRDGLSLIAYVQWLGSWKPERPWDVP